MSDSIKEWIISEAARRYRGGLEIEEAVEQTLVMLENRWRKQLTLTLEEYEEIIQEAKRRYVVTRMSEAVNIAKALHNIYGGD